MSGELPAGARLRVRDLALQVGTSVMPVREAIRRLEEAGLAERVPHKGAVVKGLTLTELEHVYDVRILLETEAAGLGGVIVAPEGCARMRQLCDEMARAVEDGRIVDALNHDEALLTILYSAGGNPVLLEMIRGLWQRLPPLQDPRRPARAGLVGRDALVVPAPDRRGGARPRRQRGGRHHPRVAAQRQGPDRGDARRVGLDSRRRAHRPRQCVIGARSLPAVARWSSAQQTPRSVAGARPWPSVHAADSPAEPSPLGCFGGAPVRFVGARRAGLGVTVARRFVRAGSVGAAVGFVRRVRALLGRFVRRWGVLLVRIVDRHRAAATPRRTLRRRSCPSPPRAAAVRSCAVGDGVLGAGGSRLGGTTLGEHDVIVARSGTGGRGPGAAGSSSPMTACRHRRHPTPTCRRRYEIRGRPRTSRHPRRPPHQRSCPTSRRTRPTHRRRPSLRSTGTRRRSNPRTARYRRPGRVLAASSRTGGCSPGTRFCSPAGL